MSLNYCPVPGASQPRGMRFDTENSRCIPAERMTPEEMRQLHRLTIVYRPQSLLGLRAGSRLLRAWMCRHPQSIAAVGR